MLGPAQEFIHQNRPSIRPLVREELASLAGCRQHAAQVDVRPPQEFRVAAQARGRDIQPGELGVHKLIDTVQAGCPASGHGP